MQSCFTSEKASHIKYLYENINLRCTVEKVDNLRDEEEEEGLGEVAENGNHGKRHAGEVAEGVSGKDL